MRIGIIGAGNGGLALGGLLYKNGHKISLWNRSENRVRPIIDMGNSIDIDDEGIKYSAIFESISYGYPISLPGVEIIFIVTPSIAHEEIGGKFPGVINQNVPIVLMPGRTYGSYAFLKSAHNVNASYNPICIEAQTLLHACRSFVITSQYMEQKKNTIRFLEGDSSRDI
jgi:opine dehydrogenase